MFPLFASWNEFVGTPVVAPFDSPVKTVVYRGYTQSKCRGHIQDYSSVMVFASVSMEIKLPPGNGPNHFRMHDQISLLISNKPECGQMLRKQQNSLKTNKLRAYD
jgi:hypothetical protein